MNASWPLRPFRSMTASTASCSLAGRAVSTWARVGPMRPRASCLSAAALRCLPMATRRATQTGLRPSRAPTARSLMPSSSIREQTTRASSEAVSVRTGALASSNSRLCSATEPARSTMTGTSSRPCSRQSESRLKPSITSQWPSWLGATRIGVGAVRVGRGGTVPVRRSLNDVYS